MGIFFFLSFYLLWYTLEQIFMFSFRVYKRASQSPVKFKGVQVRNSLGNSLDTFQYFNYNFPLTYWVVAILDALERCLKGIQISL